MAGTGVIGFPAMDCTAFATSPTGRLVPTTHGQKAFVPNALPPLLDGGSLWRDLGETMQAVGNLNGISRRLPNPLMVIRPLQRREALTSSSMEGTHASPDDLVLFEAGEEQAGDDAREVYHYIKALDSATASLDHLPISRRMICDTHRILLSGLSKFRGANKRPGEYKVHQNFIGGRSIEEARFIPPPPQEAELAMNDLEEYMNQEAPSIPPVIDAALIHYQFESIHPFAYGNGRVGRIMIPIYLMSKKVFDAPILYISPYIEENKDEYIDLMYEVSCRGSWNDWIRFFLKAVRETCDDTIKTIDMLLALHARYRKQAHEISRSSRMQAIVDSLFEKPVLSVRDASAIAKVTYPAAATAIAKLVESGILRELSTPTSPKRFIALDVVRISSGYFKNREVDTSEPM